MQRIKCSFIRRCSCNDSGSIEGLAIYREIVNPKFRIPQDARLPLSVHICKSTYLLAYVMAIVSVFACTCVYIYIHIQVCI